MRFKKLRLIIGIILIIFIFMVGNTIIFGKLIDKDSIKQPKNQSQELFLVDPKNTPVQDIQVEITPQPPADPPKSVVTHTSINTRAS